MSDAWDFGVAATIQILRAGISYLKVDAPYVLEGVSFSLAVLEGAILSATLPDRRRITLYPAVMLVLRVLFDFISSSSTENAILGVAGTLGGLLLGPVFHAGDTTADNEGNAKKGHSSSLDSYSTIGGMHVGNTPTPPARRIVSPKKPVMHHVIDVDNETSRAVLFTPAMSLRSLQTFDDPGMSSDNTTYTRVDDSFSTDDTIRDHLAPSVPDTIYQDALDLPPVTYPPSKSVIIKENVRKLRAQAKNDDMNRRALLQEREKVLQEGDASRAFLLKHQAETYKKSMIESDEEAARQIFEYYNPPNKRDKGRVDLRGLQASEAIKYCDEALRELQQAGGNMLTVALGRGKNTDGPGKGKVKPTLKQYAKAQGITVLDTDDDTVLVLNLPSMLRSPISYD
ncbi:hypothetical protein CPB86DRAFT_783077 [Serendipita vermifera]|nr:hypothetical protein CPB86DRAFT_783077 [Serendipita vermifera]